MDKNKTSTKRNPEIVGFVFPQVVHKHYLSEVGKWSTVWLPDCDDDGVMAAEPWAAGRGTAGGDCDNDNDRVRAWKSQAGASMTAGDCDDGRVTAVESQAAGTWTAGGDAEWAAAGESWRAGADTVGSNTDCDSDRVAAGESWAGGSVIAGGGGGRDFDADFSFFAFLFVAASSTSLSFSSQTRLQHL